MHSLHLLPALAAALPATAAAAAIDLKDIAAQEYCHLLCERGERGSIYSNGHTKTCPPCPTVLAVDLVIPAGIFYTGPAGSTAQPTGQQQRCSDHGSRGVYGSAGPMATAATTQISLQAGNTTSSTNCTSSASPVGQTTGQSVYDIVASAVAATHIQAPPFGNATGSSNCTSSTSSAVTSETRDPTHILNTLLKREVGPAPIYTPPLFSVNLPETTITATVTATVMATTTATEDCTWHFVEKPVLSGDDDGTLEARYGDDVELFSADWAADYLLEDEGQKIEFADFDTSLALVDDEEQQQQQQQGTQPAKRDGDPANASWPSFSCSVALWCCLYPTRIKLPVGLVPDACWSRSIYHNKTLAAREVCAGQKLGGYVDGAVAFEVSERAAKGANHLNWPALVNFEKKQDLCGRHVAKCVFWAVTQPDYAAALKDCTDRLLEDVSDLFKVTVVPRLGHEGAAEEGGGGSEVVEEEE